ncbi:hypothetical protein F5X68DRAFT_141207 [Plectosphaerella plurivora]|uniref:Uncharacterized protein n=1 Tax=Plectosphaerella plurivora TaxID=936078 RepID=A0A9P9A6R8_9PEZI|nr:hypothetical protein F5X68DRAFT_141207 [Plectosphaerella plurivora]
MWNRRTQHASSPFSPPHPSALTPPNMSSASRPPDYSEDSRRAKRRKLDSDRIAPSFKGFEYGKYGQVEPGELTMEIVSCDGGLYSDESSYACENILKNDNSVYCTKSNRCNIVLRHQGATAFSLKEIVIKAPASHHYNAPVREGMVFVSMNQDDLLQRTARYQIQYAAARDGRGRDSRGFPPIISIRHHDNGTTVTRTQSRARRTFALAGEEQDDAQRTAQMPPAFTTDPPPFNITTECSDDESDDDDNTPRVPPNRRAPNRIGALPFESDSDEESNNPFNDDYGLDDVWAPASRRRDTQNMTLTEALEASSQPPMPQQQTQTAARSGDYELMGPLAKFFIEKDKNKCTITFDPPVSGRFILLKMWSPNRETGSNIDIQGVVAHGYAGPRYFPSVQLR